MKSDPKLLEALNQLLSMELTAINQYTVHAEMCENWGYGRLHDVIWARTITEMKHAERLIERILFLDGTPIVSRYGPIGIGPRVPKMFENDYMAELEAVKVYNETIKLCADLGDNATKDILEGILGDEDQHIDEIEENQDQIEQLGEQIYLSQQIRK